MRLAVLAIMAIATLGTSEKIDAAEIAWESNLRAAHAKAKSQGKLMLLHFYRDQCPWCDRLEAGSFRDAGVVGAVNQQFVPIKIHGTKNPELAAKFKVTKYPTDVIVTTDGRALTHSVSPQEPSRYVAMLSGGLTAGAQLAAQNRTMVAQAQPQSPTAPSGASPTPQTTPPQTTPSYAQSNYASAPVSESNSMAASNTASDNTTQTTPAGSPNSFALPAKIPSTASLSADAQPRTNQFILPRAVAGASQNQLAGARTDGMTLTTPSYEVGADSSLDPALPQSVATSEPKQASPVSNQEPTPELALQGFCAVSLTNNKGWVEGKPEHGVIHLGKLYLFADEVSMETFLADPIPYTPMLNEIDVVRFFEERKIVPGKREWGVKDPIHGRMFFFADKASRDHFELTFERYLDAAIKVMDQAVKDANPGT